MSGDSIGRAQIGCREQRRLESFARSLGWQGAQETHSQPALKTEVILPRSAGRVCFSF